MTELELNTKALDIAMRYNFDLNGDDPELVYVTLCAADDDDDAHDVLIEKGLKAVPWENMSGDVSYVIQNVDNLVNDIIETFGG